MASKRRLKKDIDYLCFEVISDCYNYNYLHPGKEDKVTEIVLQTIKLRNDLIIKINNPENKKDKKLIKAHYKNIITDLFKNVDAAFNKLSELVKEQ